MKRILSLPHKKLFFLLMPLALLGCWLCGCEMIKNRLEIIGRGSISPTSVHNQDSPINANNSEKRSATLIPAQEETTPANLPAPTATRKPASIGKQISIWVPPQFAPSVNEKSSLLFLDMLNSFKLENPGVDVNIRIKSVTADDPSNMINAISAAKNAAPDALPSLAILSKNDLESIVQKRYAQPIKTDIFTETESWYPYARQSSTYDNAIYGIPIAGDALVLVYRINKIGAELTDWNDILSRGMPIGFVPSSQTTLFPTFMYRSMGGKITNDQGQAWLDQSALTTLLDFFLNGGKSGVFPPSLSQVTNQSENWQLFTDSTINLIIANYSAYRHYANADINFIALPTSETAPDYPLATTWSVALLEDAPELQAISIKLAEKMAEIAFNEDWSLATGYFPVRQSEHLSWQNSGEYQTMLSISQKASLIPSEGLLSKITPVINNAALKVIKNIASPAIAAQEAFAEIQPSKEGLE